MEDDLQLQHGSDSRLESISAQVLRRRKESVIPVSAQELPMSRRVCIFSGCLNPSVLMTPKKKLSTPDRPIGIRHEAVLQSESTAQQLSSKRRQSPPLEVVT